MRKVKCHDCGRHYDYDVDDFCPKCGAFTLPDRASRIGADGSVVWNDGINERGHQNSFVHREYHTENRKRSKSRLEGRLPKLDFSGAITAERAAAKQGKKGSPAMVSRVVVMIILLFYFAFRLLS